MLIKICEGTSLDTLETKIEAGAMFLRYLLPNVYDRGEVTEVQNGHVTVDFADTIRQFAVADITLVFGGHHGEHLMTRSDGTVLKDFRQTHTELPARDGMALEDLLDFDKWFG